MKYVEIKIDICNGKSQWLAGQSRLKTGTEWYMFTTAYRFLK